MLEHLQKKLFRFETKRQNRKNERRHDKHHFENTLAECCEDVLLDSRSFNY